MNRIILFLAVIMVALSACKKHFADPTYAASASAVNVWYKADQYYQPNSQIYIDSTAKWRAFKAFPLIYENDANKYGFGNPYVAGKGSNALYMTSIYSNMPNGGVTADSGWYNITIPKCFEFIASKDDATKGVVNVIPQKVRIVRKDFTSYYIGISGSGEFDTNSKIFTVDITFDESEIGGNKAVLRKYMFQP